MNRDRRLMVLLAGISLALVVSLLMMSGRPTEARGTKIRRTILLNFKPEASPAEIRKVLKEAAANIATLKGVRNVFAGAQINPLSDFKYGISMDFDDEAALKAYRANEEHRRIHNAYVHLIERSQITDIREE
ncbi:MAG TPA: Dabb family protein [Blastocatellia bacterium]|nr:Dabb family protein [Blastocatellia bacterium]